MTKKILAILLAVIMIFCFASCTAEKTNGGNETTPEATEPKDTEPKDTEPKDTTPERDPIKYSFVKSFTDLSNSPFSLAVKRPTGKLLESTVTWYDGNDASIKNAASGQALTGYTIVGPGGERTDIAQMDGKLIWYTGWANGGVCNVVVFTAPEDGTYDYDFVTYSWWGCSHSSTAYKVEVDGKVHNNNSVSYPKGTGVAPNGKQTDTLTQFTGTVELKAGETILFIYDPEDSSASDNSCLGKLVVTLH